MLKNCQKCGTEFIAKANSAKYCERCKKEAYAEANRRSSIKHLKKVKEQKKAMEEEKQKKSRLSEIALEARKKGMSYGRYIAYEAFREHQ